MASFSKVSDSFRELQRVEGTVKVGERGENVARLGDIISGGEVDRLSRNTFVIMGYGESKLGILLLARFWGCCKVDAWGRLRWGLIPRYFQFK
jgi:hypothetical protein